MKFIIIFKVDVVCFYTIILYFVQIKKEFFFQVSTIYELYEQLVLPLEIKYVNIILYVP